MNLLGLVLLLFLLTIGSVAYLVARSLDRVPKPQFSLESIFLWTAYVGLLAAVATGEPSSDFWALLLLPLLFSSLAVAILGVIYRVGERRAYWVGYAVFSLAYLAMAWLMGLTPSRWFSSGGSIMLALYVPVPFIGSRVGRYFYRSQHHHPDVDPQKP